MTELSQGMSGRFPAEIPPDPAQVEARLQALALIGSLTTGASVTPIHEDFQVQQNEIPTQTALAHLPVTAHFNPNALRVKHEKTTGHIPDIEPQDEPRVRELVEAHMNIVYAIVNKKLGIPFNQRDEAISDGMLGLLKAARTFDETKYSSFVPFAMQTIPTFIIDRYRERVKMHRQTKEGRNFSVMGGSNALSLDYTLESAKGGESAFGDSIADNSLSPELLLAEKEDEKVLAKMIEEVRLTFDSRHSLVLEMRLQGVRMAEIAVELGVTESRISQMMGEVTKRLRRNYLNLVQDDLL